jgi:hypothetical protein
VASEDAARGIVLPEDADEAACEDARDDERLADVAQDLEQRAMRR